MAIYIFRSLPVLSKYFAGTRWFWPQWLRAQITGMKASPTQSMLGRFPKFVCISKSKM